MHVQSISHWAPANIGPYSQAVKVMERAPNVCGHGRGRKEGLARSRGKDLPISLGRETGIHNLDKELCMRPLLIKVFLLLWIM